MSVSLSVNLSQKRQDALSNTSVVHVEVIIYYSAGSYNYYPDPDRGAVLYLIIDGYEEAYVCPFGSETTSGKDIAYSTDITVSHSSNGTRTVFASAVLVTGISAGTVSGSDSLSLSPLSGGGSGSGDDDESEYGGSGENQVIDGNVTIHGCLEGGIYKDNTTLQSGYTAVIGFRTPEFEGKSKILRAWIRTGNANPVDNLPVNVAICKSYENLSKYNGAGSTVEDAQQLATSTVYMLTNRSSRVDLLTTELESDTDYYLILWYSDFMEDYVTIDEVAMELVYVSEIDGIGFIDNGSEQVRYQIFIEDGTTWNVVILHIDNGTGWEPYS